MSGPIVNPMFFYWVDVIDSIKIVMLLTVIVGVFITMTWIIYSWNYVKGLDGEKNVWKTRAIAMGCFCALLVAGLIFIPSKEVMIQMMVAKWVTYENVGDVIEGIQRYTELVLTNLMSLK